MNESKTMCLDTQLLYQPKDTIGSRYEIRQILNEGPTSVVYLALREDGGKLVALKTIHDNCLESAAIRQAFREEAQLWVDMDRHPNILEAGWIEIESERWFIESEYIEPDTEGRITLLDFLTKAKTHPLSLEQILKWSIQLCHGMEHLHQMGMAAHRDITPSNLLIGKSGILRISDYGLGLSGVPTLSKQERDIFKEATAIDPMFCFYRSSHTTGEPGVAGTLGYIAPELIAGQNADIRSDIYSFGIILWQMVFGSVNPPYMLPAPSQEFKSTDRALMLAALLEWQRSMSLPEISGPLSGILKRCIAVQSRDRYAHFSILRSDLESVLESTTGEYLPTPLLAPRTAEDWRKRGICLNSLGRKAEGFKCQNSALEIDPFYVPAWTNKGLCASPEEEMQYLKKALEINPTFCLAWNNIGARYAAINNDQQALICYEKAVEYGNKYVSPWSNKGAVLMRLGRYQESLTCLEKAISLNTRDIRPWETKARVLRQIGQWKTAVDCCDHILIIDPLNYWARYYKSEILKENGRFDLAVRSIGKHLSISPQDHYALKMREELLKIISKDNNSLVPGNNSDISDKTAMELYALGEEHYQRKQFAEALCCYEHVLCISPRNIDAWYKKNGVLSAMKRYEESIWCCQKALLLNRTNYLLWNESAANLGVMCRYQECIEHCKQASQLNPKGSQAWFMSAQSYYGLNRHREALECYRQFLLLVSSQNVSEIAKARQRITELEAYLDEKRLKDRPQQSVMSCRTVQLQQHNDPTQSVL